MKGTSHLVFGTTLVVSTVSVSMTEFSPTTSRWFRSLIDTQYEAPSVTNAEIFQIVVIMLVAFFLGSICSLLPDIDSEHSLLQSKMVKGAKSIPLLGLFLAPLIRWVMKKIGKSIEHRSWTHTLLANCLVTFVVLLVVGFISGATTIPLSSLFPIPLAVFVGYGSHLFTDSMTISGIPYWKPFNNKPTHVIPKKWRIRTSYGLKIRGHKGAKGKSKNKMFLTKENGVTYLKEDIIIGMMELLILVPFTIYIMIRWMGVDLFALF